MFDRVTDGPKPQLVADLGAMYHTDDIATVVGRADVVIECTGASALIAGLLGTTPADGIVCLTGVSSGGHNISIDAGWVNRELVLDNGVIFGSVNANRRHYEAAAKAMAAADHSWLERLITRRVPIASWADALVRQPNDVKTILEFAKA